MHQKTFKNAMEFTLCGPSTAGHGAWPSVGENFFLCEWLPVGDSFWVTDGDGDLCPLLSKIGHHQVQTISASVKIVFICEFICVSVLCL